MRVWLGSTIITRPIILWGARTYGRLVPHKSMDEEHEADHMGEISTDAAEQMTRKVCRRRGERRDRSTGTAEGRKREVWGGRRTGEDGGRWMDGGGRMEMMGALSLSPSLPLSLSHTFWRSSRRSQGTAPSA